jgi:hypothetical protein
MKVPFRKCRVFGFGESSLYLIKGSDVVKFTGLGTPMCKSIREEPYEDIWFQKWSNTYYEIELDDEVLALPFVLQHDGSWGKDLKSWDEAVTKLKQELPLEARNGKKEIPYMVLKNIIMMEYPALAGKLTRIDEAKSKIRQGVGPELIVPHYWSQRAYGPSPRTDGFSYNRA